MRSTTVISLALGAALGAMAPPTAAEECEVQVGSRCVHPAGPTGRKCSFNSATDVTREPGWQVGEVNAGPLVTGAAGTVHCRIVLDANWHAAPSVADESGAAVGGVAVLARTVTYPATAADSISLCTSWVPDSGTPLYWVGESLNVSSAYSGGRWSPDPSSPCAVPSYDPNDPYCSVWLALDQRLGTDLAGTWQDCEGFEPII